MASEWMQLTMKSMCQNTCFNEKRLKLIQEISQTMFFKAWSKKFSGISKKILPINYKCLVYRGIQVSPYIFWHQKRVMYFLSFIVSDCSVSLELIGNGFCNDEANNVGCNFDNGDCCGSCANTEYCSDCLCHPGSPMNMDCK